MTRRPFSPSPRQQGGYILALNIAMLALMLVGAIHLGQRASLAVSMARSEQQHVDSLRAIEDAKARILFKLATIPRTSAGLGIGANAAVLDGRPYRLGDEAIVQLYDVRGRVSVNALRLDGLGRERLERLLATYGLETTQANRLVDTLLDYRDADNLRRLSGAEREDYDQTGASPPRNGDLASPHELARIAGWKDYPQLWGEDPITNHVSIEPRQMFNANTATWRTLVAMTGIPHDMATALTSDKRAGKLSDISRLALPNLSGDPFSGGLTFVAFPGDTTIVTIWTRNQPIGDQMAVTHTPASPDSPWRIQYMQRPTALPPEMDWDTIPAFPEAGSTSAPSADQLRLPF